MRKAIIFSAFFVLMMSGVADAQVPKLRVTFSEAINPSTGVPTGTVQFFVDGTSATTQVQEAIIRAANEAECFASRDFSNARPLSPDRYTYVVDGQTGLATLKWTGVKDKRDSCRVLLVGRLVVGDDLGIWQANYGSGLSARGGDSSVRPTRYLVSVAMGDASVRLSVRHPGQPDEFVEAQFRDSPSRHFVIFEGVLPASNTEQCFANTNFTTLEIADPTLASTTFDPGTAVWYLRNSNSPGTPLQGCHVVLADGDGAVDAADFAVWRTNFGSSGGLSEFDAGRPRPPLSTTTNVGYQFSPVQATR